MSQFVRLILLAFLLFSQSTYAVQTTDSQSGLLIDEGYLLVKKHCSTCHSLKIVVQSKASRQDWRDTIDRMYKQGMPLLSIPSEKNILNYLSKNYAPDNKGRRTPLFIKKWVK